jgi:phage terminase large subunit
MSEEEKAARKSGRFIALHGLIYGDFSRERHIVPERPIPENVNVVVGIDPGIRNRCAVVWIYLDHRDQMAVFQEGSYEGLTVKQVCEQIHKTNAAYDVTPLYYVIDPAAQNRAHQTGRSDQMEYADHGIVTIGGQHSVTAGINRVRERFQNDRLFVYANCTNLIDELQKYRWKQPPRTGEDGRQAPVKKDDHAVDALRYAVMSRPYLPETERHSNETQLQRAMREDQQRFEQPQEVNIGQYGGIAA